MLRFQLEGVEGPGVEIGSGSYAVVEEYNFMGLAVVCWEVYSQRTV